MSDDLTEEYAKAVKRQAEVVHDFRSQLGTTEVDENKNNGNDNNENNTTSPFLVREILPDEENNGEHMAFVIGNLLSSKECDELIEKAENYGIVPPSNYAGTLRTAKRTSNYKNDHLSELIEKRVRSMLETKFQDPTTNDKENHHNDNDNDEYMGPFGGIHNNWRILRYDVDSDDAFPPHQDQMDSYQKLNKLNGTKDLYVSSHTMLINLSNDELIGGCTRFYPKGKLRRPGSEYANNNTKNYPSSEYDYAVDVDVIVPKGWAIVFKQRGLLHAGQPIQNDSPCPKYVAQAGVLRILPKGTVLKPSIFRLGPNITKKPAREYN